MGRLAHVTRLALGRSPYGEPLRDENGDFILGPHAHDNDAPGYYQQFDERGHPQNRLSRTAARRLRKAQNDVLATVGVVVKKGEERKSKWERLEEREKFDIIFEENRLGSHLKGEDRIAGAILPWYAISLRRRLMTLQSYSRIPVIRLFARELRLFGPIRLLVGGLPTHILGSLPQLFRYYVCDPNVDGVINFINPWQHIEFTSDWPTFIRWHTATLVMRCLELPLFIHATLQSIQLIPATVNLTWRSFIPFSASSPINIPAFENPTRAKFIHHLVDTVQTPLILYLVRDYLHVQLGYRLYAFFRQLLTKPDRPDTLCAKISDELETIETTSIAGIGFPWPDDDQEYEKNKRFFGPKSFFGALRFAFPPIYKLLNVMSGGRLARSRGRLTPLLDRQLRAVVREKYWEERLGLDEIPRRGSPEDLALRQIVVGLVFGAAHLDVFEELVDPEAWTNDALGPKADILRVQPPPRQTWNRTSGTFPRLSSAQQEAMTSSDTQPNHAVSNIIAEAFRAMAGADAIIIQASDGEIVMFTPQTPNGNLDVEQMDNVHTIEAPEVALAALLQGVRMLNDTVEEIPEPGRTETQTSVQQQQEASRQPDGERRRSDPPTPTPGISRAPSLTDPQIHRPTQTTLRPLRRPTETDDSLAAISETLRAEAEHLQSRHVSSAAPSPIPVRNTETLQDTIESDVTIPDPRLMPLKRRAYRVTLLSNHVADSLAWHGSAILSSLILWPFEAMWLRAVTNWALRTPAMAQYIDPWWAARFRFGVTGRQVGVLGLGTWFDGATDTNGRFRYMGSILLTVGMEALVRGACWGVGVWYVKKWKGRYGWGQF